MGVGGKVGFWRLERSGVVKFHCRGAANGRFALFSHCGCENRMTECSAVWKGKDEVRGLVG